MISEEHVRLISPFLMYFTKLKGALTIPLPTIDKLLFYSLSVYSCENCSLQEELILTQCINVVKHLCHDCDDTDVVYCTNLLNLIIF